MQDIELPELAKAMSDIWELIKNPKDPVVQAKEINCKYRSVFVEDLLVQVVKHLQEDGQWT